MILDFSILIILSESDYSFFFNIFFSFNYYIITHLSFIITEIKRSNSYNFEVFYNSRKISFKRNLPVIKNIKISS